MNISIVNNLCTGCGVCVGACHKKAISMISDGNKFIPKVDENICNDCGLCYKICPGLGCNIENISSTLFLNATNANPYVGNYEKCYVGYSNDQKIRYHSASGGLITQMLIWLVETKKIDGVVVTKFDKNSDLKVKTFIAKSKDEILSAKSSKYSPVTFDQVIQNVKSSELNKIVIVGLPCHIQGLRKYENYDHKFKEKVIAYFSLFCSGSRTFGMTQYVLKENNINIKEIHYLAYRDEGCLGGIVIKGEKKDGKHYKFYRDYQAYCHPLRSIFTPQRCFLCIDHVGELADASFGDIHVKPYSEDKIGINSLIIKNKKILSWFEDAKKNKKVSLDEISVETLLSSQKMARIKKKRNERFLSFYSLLGMQYPKYGIVLPKIKFKTALHFLYIRLQEIIGNNKTLWFIIKYIKAKQNFE